MASVLHMSQPSETLSLSLDLSLGGLFSKYNGSFPGSLKASQISSSFPAEDLKACASLPMGPINVQWDAPMSSLDHVNPVASASHACPMDHLETRSLQAQRRHAARKRRKTRIEGKLQHKKQKGDFLFTEEATARPFSNAQYVHFLAPGNCKGGERKLLFHDETVTHPGSTSSPWATDVSATEYGDMPGTGMQVESATGDLHSRPASMVDFMDMLNANNDVQMGMEGADPLIVERDGGVSAPGGYPSSLSSISSGLSGIETFVPHESQQKNKLHASFDHVDTHSRARFWFSENPQCPEVAIPTRGSSSQLFSLHPGEKINSKHELTSDYRDESCSSSISEIENGVVRDERDDPDKTGVVQKSTTSYMQKSELQGEEQAEQDQLAATMPISSAALPHPFPILPSPYPCGLPLPWGFSLPWFAQSMSQSANGVSMAPPSSVVQSKEAYSAAIGQFPYLYQLPVLGGNISPWFPFISTGIRASPICEIAPPPPSSDYKPDVKGKEGDTVCANDMRAEAHAEEDLEDMKLVEQVQGEDKHIVSAGSDEPINEKLNEPGLFVDDAKSSQGERQLQEGDVNVVRDSIKPKPILCKGKNDGKWQAASAKLVAAERQQSLPGAGKTAFKKKKVVRFNSLDGPGARLSNVAACQSVTIGGKDCIGVQQCVDALDHSRPKAGPNEMGLTGSCGDGRQRSSLIEGNTSVDIGEKHAADNVTAHSNTTVDGDMDRQGHNAATSKFCNSDIMNNLVGIQSMTRLMKVMTHGRGPHGKTIHGIMYVTMEKQARLICMCHGKHMSSLEFVQHSGSSDLSNPERSIVLEAFHAGGHHVDIAVPA